MEVSRLPASIKPFLPSPQYRGNPDLFVSRKSVRRHKIQNLGLRQKWIFSSHRSDIPVIGGLNGDYLDPTSHQFEEIGPSLMHIIRTDIRRLMDHLDAAEKFLQDI